MISSRTKVERAKLNPKTQRIESTLNSLEHHEHQRLAYLLPTLHGRKGGEKLCILNSTIGGRNGMTLRLQMVANMHDNALACHTGVDRTLSQLKNRVYWPGMKADVEVFISACHECQRFKVDRRRPHRHAVPTQIPRDQEPTTPLRRGANFAIASLPASLIP